MMHNPQVIFKSIMTYFSIFFFQKSKWDEKNDPLLMVPLFLTFIFDEKERKESLRNWI